MISNRELKGQIEELTEQNQFLSDELQQIKSLLESKSNNQNQSSNQGQSNQGSGQNNNNALFDMANDFIQLKKLTSDLQTKMQEYASKQTRGSRLTDEDVINLIINMMNGMIDWTIDFVSKQNQSQGQMQ
ncbi:hypothetical protein [Paenibacillus oleatilyticus]|uniref:hypothetical protein n=1 Tax=Paenibacillus oleatilyticus TaxID=2594886 RepID=UPI001C1FCB22|nr:hypothetical protein [Paenibacillus oleatilyticus]MBU7315060.1 hypothetical protein [Paenibacillus oleatilyticus]